MSGPSSTHATTVLLTFNQEGFVAESIQSLVELASKGIELLVVDDASRDGTWEVIQRCMPRSGSQLPIRAQRNSRNLGIVGNLRQAVAMARGDLIFIAHGDDISLPERFRRCLELWEQHGRRHDLIAVDAFDMSHDGRDMGVKVFDDLQDWTPERWLERRPYVLGAGFMVTRRLVEELPLRTDLLVEDQVLALRAIMKGTAIRLPEPLIRHRRGGLSQTAARDRAAKRRALIRSARAGNIELEQMKADAVAMGFADRLIPGMDRQMVLNEFILDMLDRELPLHARIRRVLTAGLPWSKRLRFLAWSFMGRQRESARG
jgi:glycosyltransferase involved in cell wall biosynthesis